MENTMMKKKTSMGRQKIEIKKIEKKSYLQTSCSKRTKGVFNKAAELSILTGADVAVIVKSPSGRKFYAFGSPSPDYVFDRFLNPTQSLNVTSHTNNDEVRQLIERNKELERERNTIQIREGSGGEGLFWWEKDVIGLELAELEKYVSALEVLQNNVSGRAIDMAINGDYSKILSVNEDYSKTFPDNEDYSNILSVNDYFTFPDFS